MSNNKKRDDIDDAVEFVDHFTSFISESGDQSDDELSLELKSFGINVDSLIDKTTSVVFSAMESERLSWIEKAKVKREKSIAKLTRTCIDFSVMNMEKLLEYIHEKSIQDTDFSFAHRNLNFSSLSEDELRNILHDYEVLKTMVIENDEKI